MKKKETFFDEDITIEEKLFDNFKIANIASWSHLELWCAIQNVDIDYAFFKGILCGTAVIDKLFDIVLDAISNTEFVDKFLSDPEVIEIIEKLYNDFYVSRTFKAKEFWLEVAYKQDEDSTYVDYYNTGIADDLEKKYKLLNAIFKKNQVSVLKFYDKHKMAIHMYDTTFEHWLLHNFKHLANANQTFNKIYNALCSEVKKLNTISMYLN